MSGFDREVINAVEGAVATAKWGLKMTPVFAALAGTFVAVMEPELAGATISTAKNAFNEGYNVIVDPENATQEAGLMGNVWADVVEDAGRRVALFQRGYENPERLGEIVEEVRSRNVVSAPVQAP